MISTIHLFSLVKLVKQKFNHIKQRRKITPFDIVVFFRQFATLIASGIPITQSCDILEKSQEKIDLRLLIYSIKRELLAGKNLYHSLKQHALYFDELICQLVIIGEYTGKLDVMLHTIADYQEKNFQFKKKIKQALLYPCMMTLVAIVVTVAMLIFVVPRFAELFHDISDKLPLLTLWIFNLSFQLQHYGRIIFIAILILGGCLFHRKWSIFIKQYLLRLCVLIPLVRAYVHKIILARFFRNLAITFAGGIPIIEALKLAAPNVNLAFSRTIIKLRNKIHAGHTLHSAMAMFPEFSNLVIQMIKIGEETGALEHMLDKLADFFESEIDQQISLLNQLLEPLLIIMLGVLIGGLVIGMYLPLFKLGYIN